MWPTFNRFQELSREAVVRRHDALSSLRSLCEAKLMANAPPESGALIQPDLWSLEAPTVAPEPPSPGRERGGWIRTGHFYLHHSGAPKQRLRELGSTWKPPKLSVNSLNDPWKRSPRGSAALRDGFSSSLFSRSVSCSLIFSLCWGAFFKGALCGALITAASASKVSAS